MAIWKAPTSAELEEAAQKRRMIFVCKRSPGAEAEYWCCNFLTIKQRQMSCLWLPMSTKVFKQILFIQNTQPPDICTVGPPRICRFVEKFHVGLLSIVSTAPVPSADTTATGSGAVPSVPFAMCLARPLCTGFCNNRYAMRLIFTCVNILSHVRF